MLKWREFGLLARACGYCAKLYPAGLARSARSWREMSISISYGARHGQAIVTHRHVGWYVVKWRKYRTIHNHHQYVAASNCMSLLIAHA